MSAMQCTHAIHICNAHIHLHIHHWLFPYSILGGSGVLVLSVLARITVTYMCFSQVLQTESVEVLAKKMLMSDLCQSGDVVGGNSEFKLPRSIARYRTPCVESDALCAVIIVMETWNPLVFGSNIAGPIDTHAAQNSSSKLASKVTSLTVRDGSAEELKVSGLGSKELVSIKLKYTGPVHAAENEKIVKSCVFFNKTTANFSSYGCELVVTNSTDVECRCSHLTDFALFAQENL